MSRHCADGGFPRTEEHHGVGVSSAQSSLRGSTPASSRARGSPAGLARRAGPAGPDRRGGAGGLVPGHRRFQAIALPRVPEIGHGAGHTLGPRRERRPAAGSQPAQLGRPLAVGARLAAGRVAQSGDEPGRVGPAGPQERQLGLATSGSRRRASRGGPGSCALRRCSRPCGDAPSGADRTCQPRRLSASGQGVQRGGVEQSGGGRVVLGLLPRLGASARASAGGPSALSARPCPESSSGPAR